MEDEFKQGMFGDKGDILSGGFNVNVPSKVTEVIVTASFFHKIQFSHNGEDLLVCSLLCQERQERQEYGRWAADGGYQG